MRTTSGSASASSVSRWTRTLLVLGTACAGIAAANGGETTGPQAVARYEHIFLIIEENKSYTEIVGDQSVAPNINRLAKEYGLATQFYAEAHPSEANYIAMLGGDTFGIHDDDAYYCKPNSSDPFCPAARHAGYVDHTVTERSLMDQLEDHGLTW
jgi:phosphatidylinositol-3-phosphatase